ncbi:replication protein [Neobacillus vireti]|uniref:replication protein n=1 Tax=Neobacillus vireti TaxID=220686 RepID=UPI002FFFA53D
MPWAKHTYSRTVEVYKEMLEDVLINHQKDIDLIVRELLIRGEILKHDFTKRQMTILMFIITFSFNYGKDYAYIPKVQDFEVAGISKKHIKGELDKLLGMRVISWKKEEGLFAINEPRFWENCPYNAGYNDARSQELFVLNLQHAGIDVVPIIQKLKQMDS